MMYLEYERNDKDIVSVVLGDRKRSFFCSADLRLFMLGYLNARFDLHIKTLFLLKPHIPNNDNYLSFNPTSEGWE